MNINLLNIMTAPKKTTNPDLASRDHKRVAMTGLTASF